MNSIQHLLTAVALSSAAGLVQAQTITSLNGAAASPGTLISLDGTKLAGTTHVSFQAYVGGFVGFWTQDEPVQSATDTRVTVLVPDIVAGWVFDGPGKGDALGDLWAVDAGGVKSNQVPFYFFEGTNGVLANAGLGTTQSGGLGRSIVSFDLAGGPPAAGNPSFTPTLHNALPGAVPFLAVGQPAPLLPLDDGLLALNVAAIYAIVPGSVVDGAGNAAAGPIPVPAIPSGVGLAMHWGYVDPVALSFEFSNGLLASY